VGRQGSCYVLATLVVEGDAVTADAPVFAPQPADPLWQATPGVQRTFSLEQLPQMEDGGINIDNFSINGKKFGEGVMPQLEIGTIEEWTILNAGPLNHPFQIHQGVFIVTKINGFPIEPDKKFPNANAANYVSPLDVIMMPAFGSVTIRFRALDLPGKYVFHCHTLEHEDEGMMSPVFQFGNTEGLRLGLASASQTIPVLNGKGNTVGTVRPFAGYRGPLVAASGIGTSTESRPAPPVNGTAAEINAFFRTQNTRETMAVGTGARTSLVKVYGEGSLQPTASFRAFAGRAGRGGVSLAVGAVGQFGTVNIVAGSRTAGDATIRLFDTTGTLLREFRIVLPGSFPNGVNVAVGDVSADNCDDIIVSAGAGREPIITAFSGRDIVNGVANPERCFTVTAPDGRLDGARIAVGFVAPATVPSYKPNLITTPERGTNAGIVSHASSPDVRCGHPALRSLDAGCAPCILPSLAANAENGDCHLFPTFFPGSGRSSGPRRWGVAPGERGPKGSRRPFAGHRGGSDGRPSGRPSASKNWIAPSRDSGSRPMATASIPFASFTRIPPPPPTSWPTWTRTVPSAASTISSRQVTSPASRLWHRSMAAGPSAIVAARNARPIASRRSG